MRSLQLFCFACSLSVAVEASAAQPRMDDYAEGVEIAAQAGRPLIEVDLPDVVYRHITQPNLADLGVFNSEGTVVPHAVCASPHHADPVVTKETLPVFILQTTPQEHGGESRIDLNTSLGTAVRIEEAPRETGDPAPQTRAHVIDARSVSDALRSIQFEWRSPDDASEVRVRIEASDDLDQWRTVVEGSTLLQVQQGDRQLKRESIPLPQQPYRFLRVARADSGPPLVIASVVAERIGQPIAIEPLWFTVEAQAATSGGGWLFDAARLAPIMYARLRLPQENTSVRVRVQSRSHTHEQWRERWSGESYDILVDGRRRVSAPVAFSATTDRYWRVLPASASTLADAPMLEFGYRPARLQFLAQGSPPYTLAFGSRRAQSGAAQACGNLLADVGDDDLERLVATGSIGEQRTLGGEAALQPRPQPTPIKQIVLWAVLIGGVALLIAMAVSLLKRVRPSA